MVRQDQRALTHHQMGSVGGHDDPAPMWWEVCKTCALDLCFLLLHHDL